MNAAIASVPRSAGNGAALVVVVAHLVLDLLEKFMAKPQAQPVAQAVAAEEASVPSMWTLYRLAGGSDSVNAKVVAQVRAHAEAN